MPFAQTLTVNAARQAGRILEAFAAGNKPLLQQELERSQHLGSLDRSGLEEERIELLQAVSEGMLRAGDSLSDRHRDPAVRRCLDLLAHLAHSAACDSN